MSMLPARSGVADPIQVAFENGSLDPAQFSHRLHLSLAWRPDLLDHRNGPISRCYSKAQLDSPEARRVFILPAPQRGAS